VNPTSVYVCLFHPKSAMDRWKFPQRALIDIGLQRSAAALTRTYLLDSSRMEPLDVQVRYIRACFAGAVG
jgi:hypothetical protein